LEEALDVLLLELVVVLVDLGPELDLLDLDHLLVLSRLARALLLLVLVLAEIHDSANRRHGGGRDFDEVEAFLLRNGQRLGRRHDAQLLAVVVDDANFAHANPFVHACAIVAPWASVECDKGLLTTKSRALGYGLRCRRAVERALLDFERGVADELLHRARSLVA